MNQLHSFSAIDSYLEKNKSDTSLILTAADTAELSRIFGDLKFPGIDLADAALEKNGQTYYFRCVDFESYMDKPDRFFFENTARFKTTEPGCPAFTFKGLDNYYQSSAAYQSFLRYKRNPYRTADGKKLVTVTCEKFHR